MKTTLKRLLLLLLCLSVLWGCQWQQPAPVQPCAVHADADDNGLCDNCSQSLLATVDLYNINDLHGKLADADTHPGVDELSTYFKNALAANENTVLLSCGDMWQGSPESNMTQGLVVTDWMNQMDFAAMALGNHEFDWGEDAVRENRQLAEFPFLAINIYDRATNEQVPYCQSSVLVDCGQVQLGIIGAIGDCYYSIASERVQDVYFKTGSSLTQLVKEESALLRSQGADFIVYLLHDGRSYSSGHTLTAVDSRRLASYYDVALSNGYVDLVFEGHTHQKYRIIDEYGVYHLQNSGDNQGISHVRVQINSVTGSWTVTEAALVDAKVYSSMDDDPVVQNLLEQYDAEIAPAHEVVATLRTGMQANELRQLVAQLYYETGLEKWGEEYDIVLGGGFISIRSPKHLPAGKVTYGDLQGLFPFDNELVLCSVRGRDLQSRFFDTDHTSYFIAYGDYGAQVRRSIDPDGLYYIVVDTYSSTYKPNNLTEIARYGQDLFARDLLADYFADGG